MSWSKLAPIAKTSGRPMASASVVVLKDGVAKISLILSASLKDEFGAPEKADVSAGEGEHHGSLLIEFTPKGAFDVRRFISGGARIFVPLLEGLPDKPATNSACTIGEKTFNRNPVDKGSPPSTDSVIVRLPLDAWAADIAARERASRPPTGGSSVTPPPAKSRQRPAARHGRVPGRQGREDLAPGGEPLLGGRRDPAVQRRAEDGQRQAQGLGPRSAVGAAGSVRAA